MPHGNQNKSNLVRLRPKQEHPKIKKSLVTILLSIFIVVTTARLSDLFPYRIAIIIGIMTIGAYLLSFRQKNHYRPGKFPELVCLILIGIFVGLSVPFSVWPGNSFRFIVGSYIKTLIIFYIIIKITTDLTKLKTISYALAISGVILTGLVFLQGSTAESWRMYFGSTYDPNDTALILVVTMPFLFVFYNMASKFYKRILWLAFIIFLSVGLLFTGSRGGLVGYFVVGILLLIKFNKRGLIRNLVLFSLIIAVSVFFIPEKYWQRLEGFREVEADASIQNRFETWERGLRFMMEKPLFGVGVMGFTTAEGMSHIDIGGPWRNAHNSFIQIGAEIGIVGLISFAFLFYFLNKRLKNMYRYADGADARDFLSNLIIGLRISLAGYLVCSFFLSQAYCPLLYYVIAISLSTFMVVENWKKGYPNDKVAAGVKSRLILKP
jgi:probable O-glycosylation ligase (exosortase A-associated)